MKDIKFLPCKYQIKKLRFPGVHLKMKHSREGSKPAIRIYQEMYVKLLVFLGDERVWNTCKSIKFFCY